MKLENLDPRVKFIVLICLSTASVACVKPLGLLMLLVLTVLVLLIGGVGFIKALRQARGILSLILALFVIQCVFNRSGAPLLTIGNFALVTDGGLKTALAVSLRLIIIVFSALVLLTGEPRDYLLAMVQCKIPYALAFMVMAALRFIPILREEARDVLFAVQMRGTRLKGTGLKKKAEIYLGILVPVVSGAIQRSDQMALAMEARAFKSSGKRTSLRRLRFKKADFVYTAVFLTVFCGTVTGLVLIP